jgi:2-polyprenyl-3-methyl-5-hydroxy-6-metoxy-1,4-benzoquinol methylase
VTGLTAAETDRRDALTERLLDSLLGSFDLLAVHLGLELGLYRALSEGGPANAAELAERAGIALRYAREWLEHQAVGGILEVDDEQADADERRYALPPGHAEALLDPNSLATVAPFAANLVAAARVTPRLITAYRSGGGVQWARYPGMTAAQEAGSRPIYRELLARAWLPAIPDIHARLLATPPARVADVACGAGWSSIAMAKGYPDIEVHGLDIDPESIERARANAAAEGVGEDRLRFHLADAGRPDLVGRFDLVTIFEAVHDLARPVEVLASARGLLADGGTVVIADEKVADAFVAPADRLERLMYSYSLLYCLPNGLADPPSVGTGTVMRPATLEAYARDAGFTRFAVLPIEHDSLRLYRLDP